MALPQQTGWTDAEYLAFERESEIKHEFIAGEIIAMTGASRAHNLIVASIIASMIPQVRGTGCRTFSSDMRVYMPDRGDYAYPDITIVCGEERYQEDTFDTLLNPTVIVEVLSPSTEGYDRGKKFQVYREIESLRDYVLVAQAQPRIEVFSRHADGWLLTDAIGIAQSITLHSLDCTLHLREVYEQIDFEAQAGEDNTDA